ncbi:NAD(P)-binding protein [Hypoxylon argillaceum]|nr:NAD(P)-binding protein [Hypoxylon argillaceum]
MRAWLYAKGGKDLASSLTLSTTARRPPTPLPPDRLLVRVTYMSPNPADYKLLELGHLASILITRSLTASPGMDYAGVIEEVGRSVNPPSPSPSPSSPIYKPGDPVFGNIAPTAFGTLAEYIQPTPPSCTPLPPSVPPAAASTLGTAAQTAYQALAPYVRPGSGDEVFVNGGGGGVGTYAIQIAARALGCVVTASCSARNAELCASLGATTVLDYTTVDVGAALRARGRVFRVVLDAVGGGSGGSGANQADLYKAADDYLLPDGVFVQVGAELGLASVRATAARALLPGFLGGGRRTWKFLQFRQRREDCAQLARWMAEGKIRAVIDGDVFPFEEAPKAFEKLKTRRTRGKLVIKVSD